MNCSRKPFFRGSHNNSAGRGQPFHRSDTDHGSGLKLPRFVAVVALAALLSIPGRLAAQTNGVWNSTAASGSWSAAINWQGFFIADGTGATADFSQQTLTNSVTVHLDSARNIGSLIFGDVGNTFNWTLDNSNTTANVLTLKVVADAANSLHPSIAVSSGTATLSGVLTGTQGLVVNPGGQTGMLVLSGANTFDYTPSSNGGYGAITIDGGILSIASDVPVGMTAIATASPLGFLPPGGGAFPTTNGSFSPGNIVINGGTLHATATFQISSFRGIALGSATGGGGGAIDVAGGQTLTYGLDPSTMVNGVISDYSYGASLTLTGGGTLLLTSQNTYTGATNINGANFTLEAGIANTISRFSSVSVAASATFLLNGFNQSVGSLAGAGSVANNTTTAVTLTVGSDNTNQTLSGVLSNNGVNNNGSVSLIKVGTGNQILTTPGGATWASTGNGGGYDLAGITSGSASVAVVGGTLTIDLSHSNTLTNLINPFYSLQLGGGSITLVQPSGNSATSQSFNGTTVSSGGSAVSITTNGNTNTSGFALGAITRSPGGTVDFSPGPGATGSITTGTANSSGNDLRRLGHGGRRQQLGDQQRRQSRRSQFLFQRRLEQRQQHDGHRRQFSGQ